MVKPSLRRLAALVAVPLVASAAPLAGVASAATAVTVTVLPVPGGKIGPNAGFNNPAQGVQGTTAVLKLTLPDTTTAIQSVGVRLSGASLSIFRDLSAGDGLAIYRDTAPAGFGIEDKTAGPVSTEYRVGAPSGGQTPVTITADPTRAQGVNDYFVTLHPANGDLPDRSFSLDLPADSVATSDADTTNPAAPTIALVIDSRAPQTPVVANFTVDRQKPGIEDGYTVNNELTEADKSLAFFNDVNNVAPANLLYRPGGVPAVHAAPPNNTVLKIGDGTGRTAKVTVARNNQTTDIVYVRALDDVGNFAPAIGTAAITLNAARANDVTAPSYATSYTASLTAINQANSTAVGVTGTLSGSDSTNLPVKQEARLILLDSSGNPTETVTDWFSSTTSSTSANINMTTNVDSTPLGQAGRVIGQTRMYDAHDNLSETATSTAVTKDLERPRLISIAPISMASPSGLTEGDKVRVYFSEPMDVTKIADTNGLRTDANGAPLNCPTNTSVPVGASNCVNRRLLLAAGPGNPGTVSWGMDPGTDWSPDGTSITVTLGEPETDVPSNRRLPRIGDVVTAQSTIIDLVGNSVQNPLALADAGLLPSGAETRDLLGLNLFNQGVDGALDTIDLTMSGPVMGQVNARLTAAEANFAVVANGTLVPVESATLLNSSLIRLRIGGTLGTGVLPLVVLTGGVTGETGLVASTGLPVKPFALTATDKAPPAVLRTVTKDVDGDGHIDQMEVVYSEAMTHGAQANPTTTGYVVTGYLNTPSGTVNTPAGPQGVQPTYNSTSRPSGRPDVVLVTLREVTDFDTEVLPSVTFSGGPWIGGTTEPTNAACDLAPVENCRTSFSSRLSDPRFDGAPPAIMSRRTADLDADGYLDAMTVQYSEALRTDSIPNGQFIVDGYTVTGTIPVPSGAPDTALVLFAEKTANTTRGDTAAKPKLKYMGGADGGIMDAAFGTQNPARLDQALIEPVDGAGPAIVAATASFNEGGATPGDGTKMKVFLSEPTDEIAAGDFEVGQGEDVPAAPTAVTVPDDKWTAELTLATAVDPFQDATVELTGQRVIQDGVEPPNFNVQVSPIVAPAFPVVTLAPVGPAGSAPGYSTSRTFSTGATGTLGVVFWYLAVQEPGGAEPAAPAASEFVETMPETHTVPIDGAYTLHLWGRDDFGNTGKATAPIVVDTVAPLLGTPVLERLGGGVTASIRDNDVVRARAALLSTVSGATVTADLRNITGNPGHGAVVPFSRSGQTFYFPYVRAAGTTVYPVGTVLRVVGDNAPPFILEDGPGGTVVRRRFLSNQAMATYRIPSSHVISVPSAVVATIPVGAAKPYRDGQLVRGGSDPAVYVITGGVKRQIEDRLTFAALGYSFGSVLSVPAGDLAKVPSGADWSVTTAGGTHPAGTYVRNAQTGAVWAVVTGADNASRLRRVVSSPALMTHVGWDQVVSVASAHPTLDLEEDATERGLRDGMLIRHPNDPRVFVVSRGARRHIDSRAVFELMGFNMRNVVLVAETHVGVQEIGVPVGSRRVHYSVTARDVAGNAHTIVTSVVGLGIPEAPPATAPHAPRP